MVLHILIPITYEYVTLYGKRDFTIAIKLLTLRQRAYSELIEWVQRNPRILKVDERWQGDLYPPLLALKMEVGTWTKEFKWSLEAGKGKERDSP